MNDSEYIEFAADLINCIREAICAQMSGNVGVERLYWEVAARYYKELTEKKLTSAQLKEAIEDSKARFLTSN